MKLLHSLRTTVTSFRLFSILGFTIFVLVPTLFVNGISAGPPSSAAHNSTVFYAESAASLATPNHTAGSFGKELLNVPNVIESTPNTAANSLHSFGLRIDAPCHGSCGVAMSQSSSANSLVQNVGTVTMIFSEADLSVRAPDVMGKLPEVAKDFLNAAGLRMEAHGDLGHGIAIRQSPSARTNVKLGTTVIVWFELPTKYCKSTCNVGTTLVRRFHPQQ